METSSDKADTTHKFNNQSAHQMIQKHENKTDMALDEKEISTENGGSSSPGNSSMEVISQSSENINIEPLVVSTDKADTTHKINDQSAHQIIQKHDSKTNMTINKKEI